MVKQNPSLFLTTHKDQDNIDQYFDFSLNQSSDQGNKKLPIGKNEFRGNDHCPKQNELSINNDTNFKSQLPIRSHKQPNNAKYKKKTKASENPKTKKIAKKKQKRYDNYLMKQFNRSLLKTFIQSLKKRYGKSFRSNKNIKFPKIMQISKKDKQKLHAKKGTFTQILSFAENSGVKIQVIKQQKEEIKKKIQGSIEPKYVKFCELIYRSLQLYQQGKAIQSFKALYLNKTYDISKGKQQSPLKSLQKLRSQLGLG